MIMEYCIKTRRVLTQLSENMRIASCVPRAGLSGSRRDLSKLFRLEGLDILETIGHATAELHEAGALAKPAPALQGADAHLPAICDLDLSEVANQVFGLLKHHSSPRRFEAAHRQLTY